METEKIRFKLLNRLTNYNLIITESGCWIKIGCNPRKYSHIKFEGKQINLHILSAIIFLGMKDSQLSLHKCDIEGCSNPSHLYVGNAQDNADDRKYRVKNKIEKGIVINRPVRVDKTNL